MNCEISIQLEIWAITAISLEKQELEVDLSITVVWTDNRLTLNPNITSQSLWAVMDKKEIKQIWTPTIQFRNCKGCSPFDLSKGENVYVEKTTIRLLHKFTCAIDLRAYPMDIQFCQIQIYTYEDTEDVIRFQHYYPDKELNIDSNLTLAEYRIAPIIKEKCVYKDSEGFVFSCLELRIRLEHLVAYHIMTAFAPTSFIVILSWISFWLPLDLAPARVALGLTSLLTLATRLDQAQKNLPPVAYAKAVDVWMFYCIFLVSSSLCEFAISHYRHQVAKEKPKVTLKKIKVRPFSVKKNKLVRSASATRPASSDQPVNYQGTLLDRTSRIIFPLAFVLFNIVYWTYYLSYYN